MGDGPQVNPEGAGTYQACGGMIVSKLPDEPGVPVRRDQFDILCEGGVAEPRASRDVCLGILGAALAGMIGVLATTEWDSVWNTGRRWPFIFWVAILLVMVSGSAVGALIYEVRRRSTKANSPYSRVVAQLTKLYDDQASG